MSRSYVTVGMRFISGVTEEKIRQILLKLLEEDEDLDVGELDIEAKVVRPIEINQHNYAVAYPEDIQRPK